MLLRTNNILLFLWISFFNIFFFLNQIRQSVGYFINKLAYYNRYTRFRSLVCYLGEYEYSVGTIRP